MASSASDPPGIPKLCPARGSNGADYTLKLLMILGHCVAKVLKSGNSFSFKRVSPCVYIVMDICTHNLELLQLQKHLAARS